MNPYELVSKKLEEYEEFYEQNPKESLIKMIDLYEEASRVFNHEVCDAIDLWIYENGSERLKEHVNKKILENNRLNAHYSKWIEWLK